MHSMLRVLGLLLTILGSLLLALLVVFLGVVASKGFEFRRIALDLPHQGRIVAIPSVAVVAGVILIVLLGIFLLFLGRSSPRNSQSPTHTHTDAL